jgi:hypothetical protein
MDAAGSAMAMTSWRSSSRTTSFDTWRIETMSSCSGHRDLGTGPRVGRGWIEAILDHGEIRPCCSTGKARGLGMPE